MNGNSNTTVLFSAKAPTTLTIAPQAYADVVLTVFGANPNTDLVGDINANPDVAFDIGEACLVAQWVSELNTVKLRYFNLKDSVTSLNITAGTVFKGKITRCDNGFVADGL